MRSAFPNLGACFSACPVALEWSVLKIIAPSQNLTPREYLFPIVQTEHDDSDMKRPHKEDLPLGRPHFFRLSPKFDNAADASNSAPFGLLTPPLLAKTAKNLAAKPNNAETQVRDNRSPHSTNRCHLRIGTNQFPALLTDAAIVNRLTKARRSVPYQTANNENSLTTQQCAGAYECPTTQAKAPSGYGEPRGLAAAPKQTV